MSHSHTRILLHLVWSTKDHAKCLSENPRARLAKHLSEHAGKIGLNVLTLSVQADHVHMLVNHDPGRRIDETMQLLKGESSHWINQEGITNSKFAWQTGYGAFSVSPSHIESVEKYIKGQDEHHRKKSFEEEYRTILRKYGLENTLVPEAQKGNR